MKMVTLSEIAEINPRIPSDLAKGDDFDVSFIPMADVSEKGFISESETRKFSDVKKGYRYFERGDVLLAKITPCMENGKAALTDELNYQVGFGSTEFHVLRAKSGTDSRFLFHLVWNSSFRKLAHDAMTGAAGQKRVPTGFLKDFQIPKFSLEEQKRIADILDKADALRRKRTEALRLADEFLKSTFLDMFGDPVTNPMGWDIISAGDDLDFLTSGSRGWAKYYEAEGDIFIRIQNLRGGFLDLSDVAYVKAPDSAESRRTLVQSGDVLLSITADLGRTAVVPGNIGKAHINQHLAILRFATLNPIFVSHFLASSGGQQQFNTLNKSAVKAGLNFTDIRSIKLFNPSKEFQEKFVRVVNKVESFIEKLKSSQNETELVFLATQRQFFNGVEK